MTTSCFAFSTPRYTSKPSRPCRAVAQIMGGDQRVTADWVLKDRGTQLIAEDVAYVLISCSFFAKKDEPDVEQNYQIITQKRFHPASCVTLADFSPLCFLC